MNIALVGIFDGDALTDGTGTVRLAAIRSFIAARLHRAPMLRRVLLPTRLGEGRMAWTDPHRFDIADHVVPATPGRPFATDQDSLAWCAHRSALPLDHARPLWRMDVIPGLPRGRVGVLIVMHHVVADGLRGVAMIGGLLDRTPDAGCRHRHRHRHRHRARLAAGPAADRRRVGRGQPPQPDDLHPQGPTRPGAGMATDATRARP